MLTPDFPEITESHQSDEALRWTALLDRLDVGKLTHEFVQRLSPIPSYANSPLPVSEIMHDKGVELAGVFPMQIQFIQTFSAAVVANADEAEAGKRLIEFLTSARAAEAIKAAGLEPRPAKK